jgi:hypothetical protein
LINGLMYALVEAVTAGDVQPEQAPEMFGVAALGVAGLPRAGPGSWCGGLPRKQTRKGDRRAIALLRSRNDDDLAEGVA